MASYKIEFARSVRKDFRKVPSKDAAKILKSIQALAITPRPEGSKKLTGEDFYRVRVGAYRVIYDILDDVVVVLILRVGHRKDVYKK